MNEVHLRITETLLYVRKALIYGVMPLCTGASIVSTIAYCAGLSMLNGRSSGWFAIVCQSAGFAAFFLESILGDIITRRLDALNERLGSAR